MGIGIRNTSEGIAYVSEAERPTGPEERRRRCKQKDADGKEDMKLEDAEDEKCKICPMGTN